MIGGLFGWGSGSKPDDVLPQERGPLGIAIGGGVEIDTLSLQAETAGASPAMPVPAGGMMLVAAYGEARLDATTVLSRYYGDDDTILQVLSPSGRPGEEIFDVSVYRPWDSVVPANAQEWVNWRGSAGLIGQPRYDADGILFERFWGEGAGRADLVEFVEDVEDSRGRRSIHQSCMLYARPLAGTREMLLINIERDLGDGDRRQGASIEFIIGYGLLPGDVRRLWTARAPALTPIEDRLFQPYEDLRRMFGYAAGLPAFLAYFATGIVALAAFATIYSAITPHHELRLIRTGNTSAVVAFLGAIIGFSLPLASAAANSVAIADFLIWALVGAVVQAIAFLAATLTMSRLPERITNGEVAAGIWTAGIAIAIGMLNAACMTY